MEQGTVKRYNEAKGYGFIGREDGGKDLFFHATDVAPEFRRGRGEAPFEDGDRVEFEVEAGEKGEHAVNVRLA